MINEPEQPRDPEFEKIDKMNYEEMLTLWRFSPSANKLFEGELGDYFTKIMKEKENKLDSGEYAEISKRIGWKLK
jgi:hypothetical protein